jgi:hypothetical protein
MSPISWFWFLTSIVMTAGCIYQIRQLFAMPLDLAITRSDTCEPREERDVASQENAQG